MLKQCTKCGDEKELTDDNFHRRDGGTKFRSQCKRCVNTDNLARAAADPEGTNARSKAWRAAHPGRASAIARAWQLRNPEQFKNGQILRQYGIDFDAVWEAQEGKCASCGDPMVPKGKEPDSVCVDHDRNCCSGKKSCGKCFRGLIHRNCNLVLGYARDSVRILRCAVEYLERSRGVETSHALPDTQGSPSPCVPDSV